MELALALPLVITLMLVVLTVLAAAGAAARASYSVRRLAWANRDRAADAHDSLPVDDQTRSAWQSVLTAFPELGGPAAFGAPRLDHKSCALNGAVLPGYRGLHATRSLGLLHGTWDWRSFNFAPHDRLVLGSPIARLLSSSDRPEQRDASAFQNILLENVQ